MFALEVEILFVFWCENNIGHGWWKKQAKVSLSRGSPNYSLQAKFGPGSHSIQPQRLIVNNKQYIYETFVDLVECNICQNDHIM